MKKKILFLSIIVLLIIIVIFLTILSKEEKNKTKHITKNPTNYLTIQDEEKTKQSNYLIQNQQAMLQQKNLFTLL